MLTEHTIDNWKKEFIKQLEKQIGERYTLGGGQMLKWNKYNNIDKNGEPVGFDCCGGIMYALEETTGIELYGRPVNSFLNTRWLFEIKKQDLQEGDLILVDIPGMKNGNLLKDENGDIVYGKYNHVMTYAPFENYDIITTEGAGGDYRLNPRSSANTRRWRLNSFEDISDKIYKGKTRYKYMRIDWQWLYNWKNENQI
jgi:hypothetical protein